MPIQYSSRILPAAARTRLPAAAKARPMPQMPDGPATVTPAYDRWPPSAQAPSAIQTRPISAASSRDATFALFTRSDQVASGTTTAGRTLHDGRRAGSRCLSSYFLILQATVAVIVSSSGCRTPRRRYPPQQSRCSSRPAGPSPRQRQWCMAACWQRPPLERWRLGAGRYQRLAAGRC